MIEGHPWKIEDLLWTNAGPFLRMIEGHPLMIVDPLWKSADPLLTNV